MPRHKDLLGLMFGQLTVKSLHPKRTLAKKTRWVCECSCGQKPIVVGGALLSGRQVSCGCHRKAELAKNYVIRHGHARRKHTTTTYTVWADMVKRTSNPRHWAWKYYGGRGITLTKRWLHFENFLEDMGERPYSLTLDRVNNEGNYEKSNCRWATRAQQSQNRRKPNSAIPISERGG